MQKYFCLFFIHRVMEIGLAKNVKQGQTRRFKTEMRIQISVFFKDNNTMLSYIKEKAMYIYNKKKVITSIYYMYIQTYSHVLRVILQEPPLSKIPIH